MATPPPQPHCFTWDEISSWKRVSWQFSVCPVESMTLDVYSNGVERSDFDKKYDVSYVKQNTFERMMRRA